MLKIRLFEETSRLKKQFEELSKCCGKDSKITREALVAYTQFYMFIMENDLAVEYELYLQGEPFIDEQNNI